MQKKQVVDIKDVLFPGVMVEKQSPIGFIQWKGS